ncbi:unnamed protein product [Lupinus luteus]|uniref:Uncharacterized protein n=1 Tax=Lupinus luteus TaxID=3873 RepID=A0AAV1X105_LUPLU
MGKAPNNLIEYHRQTMTETPSQMTNHMGKLPNRASQASQAKSDRVTKLDG